jgi:hypothetical protein
MYDKSPGHRKWESKSPKMQGRKTVKECWQNETQEKDKWRKLKDRK